MSGGGKLGEGVLYGESEKKSMTVAKGAACYLARNLITDKSVSFRLLLYTGKIFVQRPGVLI